LALLGSLFVGVAEAHHLTFCFRPTRLVLSVQRRAHGARPAVTSRVCIP
jgi:hypothetical protein